MLEWKIQFFYGLNWIPVLGVISAEALYVSISMKIAVVHAKVIF